MSDSERRLETTHTLMFKVVLDFLFPSDSFLVFVLTRRFGSVLQNWAGMRCPYKLLRMILALVCSKLSSLTMLLLFMGGLCQVVR